VTRRIQSPGGSAAAPLRRGCSADVSERPPVEDTAEFSRTAVTVPPNMRPDLCNFLFWVDLLKHTTTYTYDTGSNPVSAAGALGHTTTDQYDAQGGIVKVT